jgi:hypothetical protein
MNRILLIVAVLIALLAGGAAFLMCSSVSFQKGWIEVAVSFDPPLPEGTRVEYALISEKLFPWVVEHDPRPELSFEEIPNSGDAHVQVPFGRRVTGCFGETYSEPYDMALFRFVTGEGEELLVPVRLPDSNGSRELVVGLPRESALR